MKIELHCGNKVLSGIAARLFLTLTSPWYSVTRDADDRRSQTQVDLISIKQAEPSVPRDYQKFLEWASKRRINLSYHRFSPEHFKVARSYLNDVFLIDQTVELHYL
jgi:hypothetical protein